MDSLKPHILVTEFTLTEVKKYVDQLDKILEGFGPEQPIVIQIESYGGIIDGLCILYDKIKSLPNPIITYTSGVAMSAGAILFSTVATNNNRIIGENAAVMIHEIQSGSFGDITTIENEVKFTKELNERWIGILARSMGLKEAKDVRELIREKAGSTELYLNSQQAIDIKIADIIGSIRLMPSVGYEVQVLQPPLTTEDIVNKFLEQPKKKQVKKKGKKK